MRMNYCTRISVLAGLLITSSFSYAQPPDSSIAWIDNVFPPGKGRILIKPKVSHNWDNNAQSWQLYEGDSVKTNSQTSATILYCDGQIIQLGRRKSHHVTMMKSVSKLLKFFHVLKWMFNQEKPLPQGVRGMDKPPLLLYPRFCKILSDRPSFTWLSSSPNTEYQIQLFDSNDSLIWKAASKDTVALYPAQRSRLNAGATYQVEIKRQYKNESEDYSDFSIATVAEQQEMAACLQAIQTAYPLGDSNAVTVEVVYAATLIKAEYFSDALLLLQKALKKQPNNRTLRLMMAQIYAQVGPPALIKAMLQ